MGKWILLAVLGVAGLGFAAWLLAQRRVTETVLRKVVHPRTGRVRRVYIRRPRLRAKLWFEPDSHSPTKFVVKFQGDPDGFTVTRLPGEPIHMTEAREALLELGLDLEKCSWEDIVKAAQ